MGWEYGTFESNPTDEDVEALDALLSYGLGTVATCLGPSNPFDTEVFFFGGFVIRLALVTVRLVSLDNQYKSGRAGGRSDGNSLENICNMSIFTFSLTFYTCDNIQHVVLNQQANILTSKAVGSSSIAL